MIVSYLLTTESFITNLKRAAKTEKRALNQHTHTFYLDKIASVSGFENWALLHNTLNDIGFVSQKSQRIRKTINSRLVKAVPHAAQGYVINDIRGYLNVNFEKLAEFSREDPHSENGFSHPSIDLNREIITSFNEIYPECLIQTAINILEKEGPWCLDDSEIFFDEFHMGSW